MEIARLEVSTQQHLERMQESCKGELHPVWQVYKKPRRGRNHSLVQWGKWLRGRWPQGIQAQWKIQQKTSTATQTPATDVGKEDTKRHRTAKLWKQCAEDVERKDIMKRFASRGNAPHTLEVPQANSAGAGAGEPLYFNDEGEPIYTYMVSIPHVNRHLIKFPVALEPTTLKGNNTDSPQSVLLKADTGADVNLDEQKIIQATLGRSQRSAETDTYQDGKLWKYCSESVRNVPMLFSGWKDKVYKQLFYVTDCGQIP